MKKRLLYLIETLGHGGAEHQLAETVQLLDRSQFDPLVCHIRGPGYLAGALTAQGVPVVCLDAPAGKLHWPKVVLAIRALARKHRADLIHTSLIEADILGGAAGRLANIPVVSTLCNIAGERIRLVDNPRNNRLKLAASNVLWGTALRLHRHNIAISEAVRASTVSNFHVPAKQVSVIYRGIEPSRAVGAGDPAELRQRLGFGDAEPFLLNIGRLGPQKGQRYLVAALGALVKELPRAQLAIVGEGWLQPELERQAAELGVRKHLHFLGKRTDVPDLLRACDVFVFPSLFEGLGVSLLEASYAGCAIVSTNTGPIPEIIDTEKSGLLVPPANGEALAQALLRLARDPALRSSLGQAARRKILDRFMLKDKVRELEQLYTRLLGA